MIARKTRVLGALAFRIHCRPHRLRSRLHVEPPSDSSQSEHGQPAEGARPVGQHVLLRRGHAPARSGNGRDRRVERGHGFLHGQERGRAVRRDDPRDRGRGVLERGRQRYTIYCQPCHDARGDGKGILFQRGNVPTATFHQEKILKCTGRADLRRHHERARADGRVSLADPSCRQMGDRRLRARLQRERQARNASAAAPAPRHPPPPMLRRASLRGSADGGGRMNGVMNRKLLFVLPSPVW